MRRARVPLTAWPAFADLMTILAVVGLSAAAATVIVTTENRTSDDPHAPPPEEQIAGLTEKNSQLQEEIAALQEEIVALTERIRFGARPCLGTQDDRPRTLLRIVVNAGYRLERRWLRENDGDAEAMRLDDLVHEAVGGRQLTSEAFENYADAIYRHGAAEQTFRGSCRFFVELEKGTDSYRRFSQAVGVVSRYFLIANSSEVNRLLASG